MLKKVLKSIIACSLAVGLLIGSGNEVVQAKVKGYATENGDQAVRVFYQGVEATATCDYIEKESPESDWGYAYADIFSSNGANYYGPVIIVGLEGNRVLDGAVLYQISDNDFQEIVANSIDTDERKERSTPYLKSCDFDLVVIYEW